MITSFLLRPIIDIHLHSRSVPYLTALRFAPGSNRSEITFNIPNLDPTNYFVVGAWVL